MRRITLLLLLILFMLTSISQEELQSVKLSDEYKWWSYNPHEFNQHYFNLQPLKNSTYKYHFRHQQAGHIVDIYSNDGIRFEGVLINSMLQYKTFKTRFDERSIADSFIFEQILLDDTAATSLGSLILSLEFYQTPTDSLIKGWNFNYLDCGSVCFSYKIDSNFRTSRYTCHWAQQDSLEFIYSIKTMFDAIDHIIGLKSHYSEFALKLEPGRTYSKNGHLLMYVMTDKESLAYEKSKPKREYLESIKDSVNRYLRSNIERRISQTENINCFEDYILKFNRNGKLVSIEVAEYDQPSLSYGFDMYLDERKNVRKCKKEIKGLIGDINLTPFNPKYEITRILRFGLKNEVFIE